MKNDIILRSEIEERTSTQLNLEAEEDCEATKLLEDGWDDDSAIPLQAIIREEFGVELKLTNNDTDRYCVSNSQVNSSDDGLQANANGEDIWKYDDAGNLWGEGHIFDIAVDQ